MIETIGNRLKIARKYAGMTQVELANAIDARQGAISDLESGRNNSSTKIVEMSLALKINAEWLSTGLGEMITVLKNEVTVTPLMIPVLSYVEVKKDFNQININKAVDFEPVQGEYDLKSLYWVRMEDNSMSPTFDPSNLVLINIELSVRPYDYVLALEKRSDSVVFRKWHSEELDTATDQEYSQLVAINPEYSMIDSRYDEFEILGVAVEHRIKLR